MRLLRIGPTNELDPNTDMAMPPPCYAILSRTLGHFKEDKQLV